MFPVTRASRGSMLSTYFRQPQPFGGINVRNWGSIGYPFGCGLKPMLPFWGRCTSSFVYSRGLGCSPLCQFPRLRARSTAGTWCRACRWSGSSSSPGKSFAGSASVGGREGFEPRCGGVQPRWEDVGGLGQQMGGFPPTDVKWDGRVSTTDVDPR